MAFVHGKGAYFALDNSGGSLVDISAFLDDIGFPQSIETAETTTFGKNSKTYIVGLKDSTVSLSGKWDATLDAQIAATVGQAASLTFNYAPQGNTGGNVLYSGECFITSYDLSAPIGDVVTVSIELQVTGDVTRATI
jgi:predicted secreted protein